MYASGFKEGSTRRKVYENAVRRATKKGRIPEEAKEVFNEIRKELRTYIWETSMQKMTRLDKEFEALEQGGLSHADFRALFESKLQDMEESKMDMPSEQTLYRKYLVKINPELRVRVLSKEWKIDGEGKPPRTPTTHREVALAIGLLLEEKADIHATGHAACDSLMNLDGSSGPVVPKALHQQGQKGAAVQCSHCHMADDHYSSACPQKAADTRNGDAANCYARAAKSGAKCRICSMPGHEARHHLLALQDYAQSVGKGPSDGAQGAKGGGKQGACLHVVMRATRHATAFKAEKEKVRKHSN
jgi:hypothetical protein